MNSKQSCKINCIFVYHSWRSFSILWCNVIRVCLQKAYVRYNFMNWTKAVKFQPCTRVSGFLSDALVSVVPQCFMCFVQTVCTTNYTFLGNTDNTGSTCLNPIKESNKCSVSNVCHCMFHLTRHNTVVCRHLIMTALDTCELHSPEFIQTWSNDSAETLQGGVDSPDWSMFKKEPCSDIDDPGDAVSYLGVTFTCADTFISSNSGKVFPNGSRSLTVLRNEKNNAF